MFATDLAEHTQTTRDVCGGCELRVVRSSHSSARSSRLCCFAEFILRERECLSYCMRTHANVMEKERETERN